MTEQLFLYQNKVNANFPAGEIGVYFFYHLIIIIDYGEANEKEKETAVRLKDVLFNL